MDGRQFFVYFAASVCVAILTASARAELIVDTRTPTGNYFRPPDETIPNTGWSLTGNFYCHPIPRTCGQSLAGQFYLPDDTLVDGIAGFISSINSGQDTGGIVRASVYADDGDLPESKIFEELITVPINAEGWFGVSGFQRTLSAGSYWIAFEVPEDSTFAGGMRCCSPRPLVREAFLSDRIGSWKRDDTIDIGVQISGVTQVLEPTTIALLGLGLAGLGLVRSKQ